MLIPFYRRHTLSKRRIVPLPIWKANPETDPDALFTKDTVIIPNFPLAI
jgi:SAGA-associated factor 29